MAYSALVSLAQTIDQLLHHHNDQCPVPPHDKQKFISIQKYILSLQAFLEDFPEKATSLEGRIRDVANQAEDIIEYFMSKQIQLYYISKLTAGTESAKFPHHLNGFFMWLQGKKSGIYTKLRLYSNFKELRKVAREVMEVKNSTRTQDVQLSYPTVAASSSSPVPTSKVAMVGFEEDLMAIKSRLCGESQNLEVIPILGMGGIGKTTLARNAYDDPLTMEHFDVRAWATVSQDYSAQEILLTLIVSMKAETSEQSIESMVQNVYQHLKGRRYLIVMDDMWSAKAWDDVKMVFPNDNNGSRIILTTRLLDVASYADSSSPLHKMHFMDADQSWNLLQQKVFNQEYCPHELEDIGKQIAGSCRGLPLAIVVVAGLLSTISKTRASWKNIARNVNEAITTNDEQFVKIVLSLSYINLPHHLRPCFLYMGGFPEDHEIRVSRLIKLWIAEGFPKPIGSKSIEEVAEEYLEDLVKRSLVLVSRRKSIGKLKSCNVHDLVRDLCIRKAKEEKFILNVTDRYVFKNSLNSINNQRRISIASYDIDCLDNIDGSRSTIRTIICFHLIDENSLSSLGNFKLLRILDVVPNHFGDFQVRALPIEVFELYHLRYLAYTCGGNFDSFVPPSILNLQNLQTLIIQDIYRLCLLRLPLPLEIWRMPQLRHLTYSGPLLDPEGATFALKDLQTLWAVKNFKCTEEILKMIPNLKKLGIAYLSTESGEDYHLENLVCLHQLEELKLEVYLDSFHGKHNPVFPTTLKKLTLTKWGLPWKEMSIVGSLPNLEVLKLRIDACYGYKWETSEGEFPRLKFLLIDYSELQLWITESSHFPSLECLVLYDCWNLSEIPDDIGEISTLELIEVDGRNKSLVDSAKRIKEEQQSWGNDVLQVRVGHTWRK